MSTRDRQQNQPEWNDQQVDRLLQDFFARELPRKLRGLPTTAPALVTPSTMAPNSRSSRASASVVGLGITAAALLMAAAALFGPRHDRPLGRHGNLPPVETAVIGSRTTSPANDAADSDALAAPMPSLVIERYDTEEGPVEWRTERLWVREMVVEPETGTEIELMFPELRIEIFPIDEDPPATKKKP